MRDIILINWIPTFIAGYFFFFVYSKKWKLVWFTLGGSLVYLMILWVIYGSFLIFFNKFWWFLNSSVKWWHIFLLAFIIFVLFKFLNNKKTKPAVNKNILTNGLEVNRKGKKIAIFKWVGNDKDLVGQGTDKLGQDGQPDGSFLLTTRKVGKIVMLDLFVVDENDELTNEHWDTNSTTRHWPIGVVDKRTGKRLNYKEKQIEKFVKEDTQLLLYVANSGRGFSGRKFRLIVQFADRERKIFHHTVRS